MPVRTRGAWAGGGDFADILAQDDPDIWRSNRPAKGGETGAMFEKIIARALEMRDGTSTVTTNASKHTKVRSAGSAKRTRRTTTRTTRR